MNTINKLLWSFALGLVLSGCRDKDSFDDAGYRNESYDWWVDKTGKGSWIRVGPGKQVTDGKITEFYNNGNVCAKYTLINSVSDTLYFADLNGKPEGYMFNDKGDTTEYFFHDGPAKTYRRNEQVIGEGIIENHRYAQWRFYSELGRVETTYNLKRDSGWKVDYYENGNIRDSALRLSGRSYSVKRWFEDGKPEWISHIKNNTWNGAYEEFYENGRIKQSGSYVNGKVNGEVKFWFDSGKIKAIQHVKMGVAEGSELMYYENGQLECSQQLKMNLLDGHQIGYYENGKLEFDLYRTRGLLNGECKGYSEDGKLQSDVIYKDGELVKNAR